MKTPYKIRSVYYGCHPETCNHDVHYSYKVTLGRNTKKQFKNLKDAENYCKENGMRYEIIHDRYRGWL